MIKSILFILTLIMTYTNYSQNSGNDYAEFSKNLTAVNTELIVKYVYYCNGESFFPNDINDCKNESPTYVLWIKDNKYYKRKFSDCKIHPTTEVGISDFLTTVRENIDIIKDTEILPVIHKLPKKSDGTQEEIQSVVSHSCISTFIITTKDQTIKKDIDSLPS